MLEAKMLRRAPNLTSNEVQEGEKMRQKLISMKPWKGFMAAQVEGCGGRYQKGAKGGKGRAIRRACFIKNLSWISTRNICENGAEMLPKPTPLFSSFNIFAKKAKWRMRCATLLGARAVRLAFMTKLQQRYLTNVSSSAVDNENPVPSRKLRNMCLQYKTWFWAPQNAYQIVKRSIRNRCLKKAWKIWKTTAKWNWKAIRKHDKIKNLTE